MIENIEHEICDYGNVYDVCHTEVWMWQHKYKWNEYIR